MKNVNPLQKAARSASARDIGTKSEGPAQGPRQHRFIQESPQVTQAAQLKSNIQQSPQQVTQKKQQESIQLADKKKGDKKLPQQHKSEKKKK